MAKTIYSIKTPDGNPVRAEEAWKDSDGNLLNKKVTTDTAQTISGAKTFSSQVIASGGVKTDKVTSTNGTEVLAYNGTTTALKGKADRPTYNGGDLALKSDVTDIQQAQWKDYYAQCNVRKYQGITLAGSTWGVTLAFNSVENKGTAYDYMYAFVDMVHGNSPSTHVDGPLTFSSSNKYSTNEYGYSMNHLFWGSKIKSTITLPSLTDKNVNLIRAFQGSAFTKILTADGGIKAGNLDACFQSCANLTEIGAFDVSSAVNFAACVRDSYNLKSIHFTHITTSFQIFNSTAFEEADLVEIIGNLDPVSTTQTLTMGSTNLAKLTDDEILVATGKGWALA